MESLPTTTSEAGDASCDEDATSEAGTVTCDEDSSDDVEEEMAWYDACRDSPNWNEATREYVNEATREYEATMEDAISTLEDSRNAMTKLLNTNLE